MNAHVGDDAPLYALGMLDEGERSAIDAHATVCDACSRLLAQACDDVAAMVHNDASTASFDKLRTTPEGRAMTPEGHAIHDKSRRLARWFPAMAAAVVIAVLPSAYLLQQNYAMHASMEEESQAMERMATSPYRTVAFAGVNAKVMYGMDGSWYCILIHGAKAPLDVAWMHDGTKTMLGTAVPHGDVAVLYLPKSHKMNQLALVSEDRTMGQAQLVF
jgi:hypothetical protein